MLEAIQRLKVPFYLPVLLLANKNDLEHYRQVRLYQIVDVVAQLTI